MLDLALAIVHHLLVFGLFGILFAEFMLVRPGMEPAAVRRVAGIDLAFGALAGLVLIVGFARAGMAAKGWAYYSHNGFFWAKIGVFLVIGLLSAPPTIAFIRWRKAGAAPTDQQVAGVRRFLHAEVVLFALLPAFAAAMARGYGQF
jgi:putative membrane protein